MSFDRATHPLAPLRALPLLLDQRLPANEEMVLGMKARVPS